MDNEQFQRGDRVAYDMYNGFYGEGIVKYLDGDPYPDDPSLQYDWPGHVCIEFDTPIDGKKPVMWCEIPHVRKV